MRWTLLLLLLPLLAPLVQGSTYLPIRVENFRFVDGDGNARTEVPAGFTIRWQWFSGAIPHTVTQGFTLSTDGFGGARFDSGSRTDGATFDVTFTKAGLYRYACVFHGSMTGEVLVVPPSPLPS